MELIKKIDSLNTINVGGCDKYVIAVHWRITGIKKINEVDYISTYFDSTSFEPPIEQNIIPFNELTEDIVFGWLNLDINEIIDIIEKQLEKQINPPVLTIFNPFNTLQNEDSILQPTT
jgi:hypothetical protein